jgi:transcriptional antiterminator RfaH
MMAAAPWFAAQLRPQGERIVLAHLRRQGFEAALPRRYVDRRVGSRFRRVIEPIFPGYVFVTFDPEDPASRAIRSTRGIARLIGNERGPSALPTGFVEALMARCDHEGLVVPDEVLPEGSDVRVLAGPFAGLLGKILRSAAGDRVAVLLTLLASERSVLMPRGQLVRA